MDTKQRIDLGEESWLDYYPDFFPQAEADGILADLLRDEMPWEHQPIMGTPTLRANAWFADDPRHVYRYSGQTWTPHPLTPRLRSICERLEAVCRSGLNCALGALYPDGRAAVAWHDDNDFPSLPDRPLASVSFGSERTFKVRRKADKETLVKLDLPHGSLVVMGGAMQHHFDHAIAKSSRPLGPRVNFSYRTFYLDEAEAS